jgi:hypothetical protein
MLIHHAMAPFHANAPRWKIHAGATTTSVSALHRPRYANHLGNTPFLSSKIATSHTTDPTRNTPMVPLNDRNAKSYSHWINSGSRSVRRAPTVIAIAITSMPGRALSEYMIRYEYAKTRLTDMRRIEYARRAFIGAHKPEMRNTTPNPVSRPRWRSSNHCTTSGVSQSGLGGGCTRVTRKNSTPYSW